MELKDYYAIMGVKPTDDLKTIKTAYRRLARKYHPDVSKEPDAEARFKEVAEAWEVLSDEQRRAEYDQMWQHRNDPQFNRQFHHGDGQSFNAEDFDDIFSSIFGQHARQSRQRPAARGHDIEIEVAVFLEETLTEHKRTISYNLPVYNAFGMIEQEIPKTLNVKIPAGVMLSPNLYVDQKTTGRLPVAATARQCFHPVSAASRFSVPHTDRRSVFCSPDLCL